MFYINGLKRLPVLAQGARDHADIGGRPTRPWLLATAQEPIEEPLPGRAGNGTDRAKAAPPCPSARPGVATAREAPNAGHRGSAPGAPFSHEQSDLLRAGGRPAPQSRPPDRADQSSPRPRPTPYPQLLTSSAAKLSQLC